MLKRLTAIALFAILLPFAQLKAQNLILDSVTLSSVAQVGDPIIPSFQGFISGTRDPALFGDLSGVQTESRPHYNNTTLEIEFHLSINEDPRNLLVLGFLNRNSITELYSYSNSDTSIASTELFLSSERQDFNIRTGYLRKFRTDRKWRPYVGLMFDLGLPISGETIVDLDTDDNELYNFFAKRRVAYTLNIPIGFHLKLFRGTYLNMNSMPSYHFNYLDGSNSFTFARGLRIGFAFRLNDFE